MVWVSEQSDEQQNNLMNAKQMEWQLLHDPSRSEWLKQQVQVTAQRTPLDAYHDAAALFLLLGARCEEATELSTNRTENVLAV